MSGTDWDESVVPEDEFEVLNLEIESNERRLTDVRERVLDPLKREFAEYKKAARLNRCTDGTIMLFIVALGIWLALRQAQ